jgi:hypothetical protein
MALLLVDTEKVATKASLAKGLNLARIGAGVSSCGCWSSKRSDSKDGKDGGND